MFTVKCNNWICFQSGEALRQTLSSSAPVPFGIAGSVCQKSPAKTTVAPPMWALLFLTSLSVGSTVSRAPRCYIVHSLHTINHISCKTLTVANIFEMLQTGDSVLTKFRRSLKAEWAALPPVRRVAAIPDDATARAMYVLCRTLASRKLISNILPVPPGAYKKKTPPLRSIIMFTMVL